MIPWPTPSVFVY